MSLDFSKNGFEDSFQQALREGINLFCGAGFSVGAADIEGHKLPVGTGLLTELKQNFPDIESYTNLSRACTKLCKTNKAAFYSFLERRFKVHTFDELYHSLKRINIENVYTTNIDDLFFKIYEDSLLYLNDGSQVGASYDESFAIHYHPLHGCIRNEGDYVFGVIDLVKAYLRQGSAQSWQHLADDAAHHSILFWGWNFSDPGPIDAMYANESSTNNNTRRWFLLYEYDDEKIDYLESLGFNIIIGSTSDMLDYIDKFAVTFENHSIEDLDIGDLDFETLELDTNKALIPYQIPRNDSRLPTYPLKTFFLEYAPRWSHIYSGNVPKTICYRKVANALAAHKNVIVVGIRGSGKTTLMMQLLADFETRLPKHYMVAPSLEQAQAYIKILDGKQSMLFIDDCFRDTRAIATLLSKENIQVIGVDRDFNYERQYHKIKNYRFEIIDITDIAKEDAQSIINCIPFELKKETANTSVFEVDPTILALLASVLKSVNFHFIDDFYKKDPEAARVFLMISYVHSCGTPCSFDMIYSFLGDENYTWEQMFAIVERIGRLITDITGGAFEYNILDAVQNYYQCRSRYFAEMIISNIPHGHELFASVLYDFAASVPPFKICMYDKFKRSAFDADLARRAFTSIKDGEKYYKLCVERDESEYIYQQAALYFARNGDYQTAFSWIDKAWNLSHINRFSINSTYAQIYFDVNLYASRDQAIVALEILQGCCESDKRKSIHYSTFAKCCLRFYEKYEDDDAVEFVDSALYFINEGLDDNNISLSKQNKQELQRLKSHLEKCLSSH